MHFSLNIFVFAVTLTSFMSNLVSAVPSTKSALTARTPNFSNNGRIRLFPKRSSRDSGVEVLDEIVYETDSIFWISLGLQKNIIGAAAAAGNLMGRVQSREFDNLAQEMDKLNYYLTEIDKNSNNVSVTFKEAVKVFDQDFSVLGLFDN